MLFLAQYADEINAEMAQLFGTGFHPPPSVNPTVVTHNPELPPSGMQHAVGVGSRGGAQGGLGSSVNPAVVRRSPGLTDSELEDAYGAFLAQHKDLRRDDVSNDEYVQQPLTLGLPEPQHTHVHHQYDGGRAATMGPMEALPHGVTSPDGFSMANFESRAEALTQTAVQAAVANVHVHVHHHHHHHHHHHQRSSEYDVSASVGAAQGMPGSAAAVASAAEGPEADDAKFPRFLNAA